MSKMGNTPQKDSSITQRDCMCHLEFMTAGASSTDPKTDIQPFCIPARQKLKKKKVCPWSYF